MADVIPFDAVEDDISGASAPLAPVGVIPFDAVLDDTISAGDLNAASGQVGKGLTFGFFDELQGAEAGVQSVLRNALGLGDGTGYSDAYAKKVNQLRGIDAAYERANPKTAFGLNMLGAVVPSIATAGMGAAPGVGGTLARTLYGAGIKEAPTVGQLIKMGVAGGAITGAGETNANDLLSADTLLGAAKGGVVGGVAAPVLGKALEKSLGLSADFLANRGIIGGKGLASTGTERGSFGFGKSGTSYTPEELYVAQQLKNTPVDEVIRGADELTSAVSNDVPLFVPDAIQSADVSRNAKFIAQNKDSMRFAQEAIASRKEGAGGRIEALLSDFAPAVDPTSAGTTLRNASESAVSKLEQARRDATAPLYKILEGQKVPDEVAIELLDDPVIDAAIKTISKNPVYQKEIGKASPESFKYLQLVKENLNDQVDSLVRSGSNNEARLVGQSRDKVVSALEKLDDYKKANALYRELSQPINKLAGTKDESGLLEGILNTDRINIHKAPSELLKRTPAQILEIKETLGERGQEELSKSARSLMQDVLEKANERNQPALKLLENQQMQNKFKAMMGDDAYRKFATAIDLEKRMAQANNLYGQDSPTHGYFQEEAAHKKVAGLLAKLNPANWKETLGALFETDMPADLAQKVAKIYFDPRAGKESLDKILPLLQQYAKNKSFSEGAGKAAGAAGAKSEQLLRPSTEPTDLGTIRGVGTKIPIGDDVERAKFDAAMKAAEQPKVELTPIPSQLNGLPKAERIKKVADFVREHPPLIQAVIRTESAGDPFAQSPTGPLGLMQLTRRIAKAYGAEDRLDPKQNVKAGTAFLEDLSTKYDDPYVVLAAYQAGETLINAAIKKAGKTKNTIQWEDIKNLVPKETQNYPYKVEKHLNDIIKT